ncbi:MAG: sigma-70 family RNA polymerase sigma factor [Eubacteriales bacterium]|nr:sigma-70 family RNA polymerase sigma factor [Eubacteriales bacterium]MDD3881702.1 sigma-70 family RNA polymerase sigma factor [Eubacteriales bacterium]MDD4512239.1 sigma-70 family RNA polymerase sigma factor [Eubacteriales bacterium]
MDMSALQAAAAEYSREPDKQKLDGLVEMALPLAERVARQFSGRGIETEDLFQIASIALMQAAKRYKAETGLKFITYAMPTMAGSVRNYLRDKGQLIRAPRAGRQLLGRIAAHSERFLLENGREPSVMEISEALGVPLEDILDAFELRKASGIASLDAPVGEDEGASFMDLMPESESGYDRVEREDFLNSLKKLMDERDRELFEARFAKGLGQRETAKHLGVSQMQVSRLERRLLEKLRAYLKSTQQI